MYFYGLVLDWAVFKTELHTTVLIKKNKLNLHNVLWPAADNDPMVQCRAKRIQLESHLNQRKEGLLFWY